MAWAKNPLVVVVVLAVQVRNGLKEGQKSAQAKKHKIKAGFSVIHVFLMFGIDNMVELSWTGFFCCWILVRFVFLLGLLVLFGWFVLSFLVLKIFI